MAPPIALDISALRQSAPFRHLFGAQLISTIGSQITVVALMIQVYSITESTLLVGLLGLAQIGPTIGFSLLGGAIADAMDRRRLLLIVQVGMCAVSTMLAILAVGEPPPLWSLYVLAAIGAAFASVDGPTRQAVIPTLVDAATLRSAVQLREVMTQSGRTFGPFLGGILIATLGLPAAYLVDAATFVIAFLLFRGLPSLVPTTRRRFELSAITEGLRYVRKSPILASTFVADLIAMVLGMPRAVFPAFGALVFHVGAAGVGYMYAAPAAGALIGLLFAGLTSRVHREGRAVLISIAIWGLAIAAFAVTPWFGAALLLLAMAGAADMVSAIFRQTMLLSLVPDELRGRMSSVHIMIVTGGPPLGDLEAGAAAELVGLRSSVVLGGLACAGGMVLLALRVPGLARWVDPERERPA